MDANEFRRHGHQIIDWIANYMEHSEDYPVLSRVSPGEVRAALSQSPPEDPEPFDATWRDVEDVILPGITHWQSPNFFAFFPCGSSYPSILGDLLSSGLGVQGMMWATSPAATELETLVMDWLAEMLDLPEAFHSTSTGGGVIQATASSSSLVALLAARERATAGRSNQAGINGGGLTVYTSQQAHSSIEKDVRVIGIGAGNLRLIEIDEAFSLRPDRLREAIAADKAAGRTPVAVCATVGTTPSGAIDPVRAIGEICREQGVWLHVDAAMFGTAAVCPEFRWVLDGLEYADSFVFNPHKWMLTSVDCSALFLHDRRDILRALSILPEYLRNEASDIGTVIDYKDWQIELGRRFRALKLWFVIRSYGVSGIRDTVRRHVDAAREFAAWVEADPDFELAAPPSLTVVCFRHPAGDDFNLRLMERINATGKAYISHAVLDGHVALRMSIGQRRTEPRHVEAAWVLIRDEAAALSASTG